jgi:exodeoxyribonuclease VII small subunit
VPKKAKPSFEEDLARLAEIVELLEEGPDTLGEMLALYEEGTALAARLQETLEEAATKVMELSRGADGEPTLEEREEEL